jgi:hypothetical protein
MLFQSCHSSVNGGALSSLCINLDLSCTQHIMTSDIRTPKTFYVGNKITAVIVIYAIIVTVLFVGYCIGIIWIEGGNRPRRGGGTGTLDEGQRD